MSMTLLYHFQRKQEIHPKDEKDTSHSSDEKVPMDISILLSLLVWISFLVP